jgi:hypothetical protein
MKFTVKNKIQVHGAPEKFKTAVKERLTSLILNGLRIISAAIGTVRHQSIMKCYERAEEALKAYFEAPEEGSGGKSKG